MQTRINGREYSLEPGAADELSAAEFIRERCGLTGTKLVCAAGVCGACAVRVDGAVVNSCLLPATALDGCSVETVEAHGAANLHPVQRALMAHDGLQCGFCTPGFVVEGIAFYERWRAEHGPTEPTRAEVAAALSGHLCRCGAYVGIIAALQAACAGRFEHGAVRPPRVEAAAKVSGSARYTVDVHYDGQLEGAILRSNVAHARVNSIDLSPALALPGVMAAVELLAADRTVRYVGQELAAVAATDRRTALAALAAIKVELDPLPAVIGMAEALAPAAPAVYDGPRKPAPSASEFMVLPGSWENNRRTPLVSLFSRRPARARKLIAAARAAGDPGLVEAAWHTGPQSHSALESHSCVARWDGAEHVTVHISTQSVDHVARDVAHHLGLKRENVQVLCEFVGGAFGAKQRMGPEAIAAISLSKESGAPVRVALDRAEELTVGGYRPAMDLQLALLADEAGQARAFTMSVNADLGVAINSLTAVLAAMIYDITPREVIDYDVVSNVAPAMPFRAPGGPQATWALESAVDALAHKLGKDPLHLRQSWDSHAPRQKLYRWAADLPAWRERGPVAAATGRFRRGVGLAAANWSHYFLPAARVEVRSGPAGISVSSATQDMGNGSRSVLATTVAAVFGLSPTAIQVQIGDSQAPRGPHSAGSMTTSSLYAPARRAARKVREQLLAAATVALGLHEARVMAGGVAHDAGTITWTELLPLLPPQSASATRGLDRGLPGLPMTFGMDGATNGRVNAGAVYVAEVEVDTRLGKIRPLHIWAGLAVGRLIVPPLAHSQCYGGIIQGLGYALFEQRHVDPHNGQLLSSSMENLHLPGIGDTPEITLHFEESGFEHALGKGIGLSEISTLPVAAALGNAVFHATGWRPYAIPILPQSVLEGLR